jgi:large subunit ribosomal protein L29
MQAEACYLEKTDEEQGLAMKADDLRQMSDEQLDLTLKEMVKNLFHLRFQSATDRLETPSEIQKAKRDVARIKTVMRERQQGTRGQTQTSTGK